MTKQEAQAILDINADDDMAFYDITANDLLKVVDYKVNPKKATPVMRFLSDHNACLGGLVPWLKFDTCEAALRSAHRQTDRDALSWFLTNVNVYYGNMTADGEDYYYGKLRPVSYFLDLIPKAYRTAEPKAKKTAKKATNAKRRSRR